MILRMQVTTTNVNVTVEILNSGVQACEFESRLCHLLWNLSKVFYISVSQFCHQQNADTNGIFVRVNYFLQGS